MRRSASSTDCGCCDSARSNRAKRRDGVAHRARREDHARRRVAPVDLQARDAVVRRVRVRVIARLDAGVAVGVEQLALDARHVAGPRHVAQDADELLGHLGRALEALLGLGPRRLEQEPVERLVLREDRRLGGRRQRVLVLALEVEVGDEHRERAGDAVEVTERRGRVVRLGRGVALAAVDVAAACRRRCRTAPRSMSFTVSSSTMTFSGLKSQYTRPISSRYCEGRQDLDDVRDGLGDGQGPPSSLRSFISVLPLTNSMTMKPCSPWVTKS